MAHMFVDVQFPMFFVAKADSTGHPLPAAAATAAVAAFAAATSRAAGAAGQVRVIGFQMGIP